MNMKITNRAILVLYVLFLLPGLAMATWVTRTPALRDGLSASTEQMGIILFGFSAGAMVGILSAGVLVSRLGANRVILLGLILLSAGLMVLAIGYTGASIETTFAGLFLIGAGIGWAEIAVNIEGAAVERQIKRPIMTALHGNFSLGTLIGAVVGMGMTAFDISLSTHLAVVAVVSGMVTLAIVRRAPRASEAKVDEQLTVEKGKTVSVNLLKDPILLGICFVVLAMALAEGAANDWLPLLMIDGHGFGETTGTLIYVTFTLGMTIGRFAGGAIVNRIGIAPALQLSAVIGAVSLLTIIFIDAPWIAAFAVVFWGLGASLGFPLAISAAAASGSDTDRRVRLASTAGYFAFLVGPPMLGFIGEAWGLRYAMIPVLLLVAFAFIVALKLNRQGVQQLA
jgi:fucose permease